VEREADIRTPRGTISPYFCKMHMVLGLQTHRAPMYLVAALVVLLCLDSGSSDLSAPGSIYGSYPSGLGSKTPKTYVCTAAWRDARSRESMVKRWGQGNTPRGCNSHWNMHRERRLERLRECPLALPTLCCRG